MLHGKTITKTYKRLVAVNEVSFSVRPGRILGLLGPNGAGKTTLLRILSGYCAPDSGDMVLDNRPFTPTQVGFRAMTGYLPEDAPVYPDLTVHEFLEFIAVMRGFMGSEKKKRIEDAVQTCGLGTVAGVPLGILSRGFRQRAGLAQALLHSPRIILLDEPSTGLDPNQIRATREVVRSLGEKHLVILSTHLFQEVEAVCDDILILDRGSVVWTGPREEIGDLEAVFAELCPGERSE
jgi:ABC-2 type transport system ATP-binding protein